MKNFKLWFKSFIVIYIPSVITIYLIDLLFENETKPIEKYLLSNILFSIVASIIIYKMKLNNHHQRWWNFDRQECLSYLYQSVGQAFLPDYINI